MDLLYKTHIEKHLRNPHINYIIEEDCKYCKLDRRISYSKHFKKPRNLPSYNIIPINFSNLNKYNHLNLNNTTLTSNNLIQHNNQLINNQLNNLSNNQLNNQLNNLSNNSIQVINHNNQLNNQLNNQIQVINQYDDDDSTVYGFPNDNIYTNFNIINRNSVITTFTSLTKQKCPICYDDITFNQVIRILNCIHIFHQKCVDEWLETHKKCPMCRYVLQ